MQRKGDLNSVERRLYLIGVIGAIGAGKSTVAKQLEKLGAVRIDADAICHQLLESPQVIDAIRRRFGESVIDAQGRVDRPTLADQVFDDAGRLGQLNAILHPRAKQVILDRIADLSGHRKGLKVVLEVALLLESGWDRLCDAILFVEADEEQRKHRVVADRNWSVHELRRREQHQKRESQKRAAATVIINNTGTLDHTHQQVTEFWRGLGR